jgi:chromosome segregation protein
LYLKSLTLRGFKSFASSTTLNFEPGITCVVGPNGSGKSNVVDALSWVMGEQGAKTLRGGKMEDVIFAGTTGRAPLGRAEVVLTIDNSDGALPIEYAEVTIARTMFRHGGSEYAINGQPSRLLDIAELLSDSGIGREMHVIVGQGQLDSILQATPEGRRGFIEEAAGVLKHRKRKEKALRKLEACEVNLNRLADLIAEIRRQLKPLGRQAEVARKAAVVQAEARDARARLLADDLVQATLAWQSDQVDADALRAHRTRLEQALDQSRRAELDAEEAVRAGGPRLSAAQDTWFALAALRERVATTVSIAHERTRNASTPGETRASRDPEELEAEAALVDEQERQLAAEVADRAGRLAQATARLATSEQNHRAEAARLANLLRAAADRREGLARLTGQVNALRSRADAAQAEIGRLSEAASQAAGRAASAERAFTARETEVAGLDAGEVGLDTEHEGAVLALAALDRQLEDVRQAERVAAQDRAALTARVEALRAGLHREDAGAQLLATAGRLEGVLGSVAEIVEVDPADARAVAAALGPAADAVAMSGTDAALRALAYLKVESLGRASLLIGNGSPPHRDEWPELPAGARWAAAAVTCRAELRPAVDQALHLVALVEDLAAARALVSSHSHVIAATRDGDLWGATFAAGGSAAQPSGLELQAAVEDTELRLVEAGHTGERLRFAQSQLESLRQAAAAGVEVALARLHESDAAMAAVTEELAQLNATVRSACEEAERMWRAIGAAEQARDADLAGLADLEQRLEHAERPAAEHDPDPAERDRLAEQERSARVAEMDARLGLRTIEERVRGLTGRAETLRRTADRERQARAEASARAARLRAEAQVAAAVERAGTVLARHVESSLARAAAERTAAEAARGEAEAVLVEARRAVRALGSDFETLVDSAHREEIAQAEHRMRIEALTERAMTELGLVPETLTNDYGPEQPVPVLTRPDGAALAEEDERPEPVPYAREQQQKRLRAAERALAELGRVNPLALEEFDALQERHLFLSTQLEDLQKTRTDLLEIIAEVDGRVEQVFAEAYADVERAFSRVFARLFPGGEGRLVLTEPGSWLTSGVDVEARPAGKKVKRLSLLSGGERSLVAVAFLVSLFIARPSPFYILDEVEAALDDVNLGRLLEIYEELRESSQLLVITHQKRTMEIADALYGVTMRGDGVSAVISQRLREPASVA